MRPDSTRSAMLPALLTSLLASLNCYTDMRQHAPGRCSVLRTMRCWGVPHMGSSDRGNRTWSCLEGFVWSTSPVPLYALVQFWPPYLHTLKLFGEILKPPLPRPGGNSGCSRWGNAHRMVKTREDDTMGYPQPSLSRSGV